MVGNNTMELNEATLIAAVQCYFDTLYQAGKVPKVKSIKPGKADRGYGGDKNCFEITVEAPIDQTT